jgi:gas vesicle protein
MFSAISGVLSAPGRSQSMRTKASKSTEGSVEDSIEHKNKIIDALTAELTQKVIQIDYYMPSI